MREEITSAEQDFDLNKFKEELDTTTQAYATASYRTYGPNGKSTDFDEKVRMEGELYIKLQELCSSALLETKGDPRVMDIIETQLLHYMYPVGAMLFSDSAATKFYKTLALNIAQHE